MEKERNQGLKEIFNRVNGVLERLKRGERVGQEDLRQAIMGAIGLHNVHDEYNGDVGLALMLARTQFTRFGREDAITLEADMELAVMLEILRDRALEHLRRQVESIPKTGSNYEPRPPEAIKYDEERIRYDVMKLDLFLGDLITQTHGKRPGR